MQKVVHFRVLVDYEKDVFRDIEIRCDDSFLSLHNMIQEAFGFDNSQMSSFYVSNDDWERGQEITLMEVKEPEEDGEPIWLMNETAIDNIVLASDQKLIYVFDFLLMWCFYVDVIGIKEVDDTIILPRISQEYGTAPNQYDKSSDIIFDGDALETEVDDVEENELDQLFRMMGNEEI